MARKTRALSQPSKNTLTMTNVGIIAGGLGLGYLAYPSRNNPVGMTLIGAGGSLVAAGVILFLYDILHDRRLIGTDV